MILFTLYTAFAFVMGFLMFLLQIVGAVIIGAVGLISALLDKDKNIDDYCRNDSYSDEYYHLSGGEDSHGFSNEEILAMGLYPDDEGYKMSLISNILNK